MNALQNIDERDIDSTSLKIVEPVVVNPDTVCQIHELHKGLLYGRPILLRIICLNDSHIADIVIHEAATLTKPSIEKTAVFLGFLMVNITESRSVIPAGMTNDAKI